MQTRTRNLSLTALLCATLVLPASAQQKTAPRGGAAQQPAASAPAAQGPVAIRGGRVLTVSKGVIENGVVVIEGGKIAAVGGANTAIPRGARIIEAKGMTVYPGLIDSETQLGLTEVSAVDMTNDLVEPSDNIMPHMRPVDAFHAESTLIPVTRVNGVTNAVVVPAATGTLPGQMMFVQLAGSDRDEMIVVPELAMPLNFTGEQRRKGGGGGGGQGGGQPRFPTTRMGVMAQLRQALLDAQDYERRWNDFRKRGGQPAREQKGGGDAQQEPEAQQDPQQEQGKESGQGDREGAAPKRDLKLEALLPYLHGERPVVITAEETSDVKVALQLAREFKLKVVLNRVTYAQSMFDQIAAAKVPVLISTFYKDPKDTERYDTTFRLPAELHKRGIKIAFATSEAHQVRNLPYAAGYAVAYGLPHEAAMRALTLSPAEIWGVADRMGSLDVGKVANVVVANGDPLDVKTDVKHVFIAGQEVPMDNFQMRLRDQYWKRSGKQ